HFPQHRPARHLNSGPGVQKEVGHLAKILNRSPENRRLPEPAGLQNVVAAGFRQRTAHKRRIRQGIRSRQLADRIQHEHVRVLIQSRDRAVKIQLASPHHVPARGLGKFHRGVEPVRLPRRHHQQRVTPLPLHDVVRREHTLFLSPRPMSSPPAPGSSPPSVPLPAPSPGQRSCRRTSPASHLPNSPIAGGSASYFKFPVTSTSSSSAPISRSRLASSSLCARNSVASRNARP